MPDAASVLVVAVGALLTALATGLGPLPLLGARGGGELIARASGIATGVMVAAGAGLLVEGAGWSLARTLAGCVAGAAFVIAIGALLDEGAGARLLGLPTAGARAAVLIMAVMTAHSAAEGIGVGVAYGGGDALGVTTSIAIALHNVPEGLAIGLVMVPRGTTVRQACGWSIASSLPQPLLAVPAFLLVGVSLWALPAGLGFAGGAMMWMALAQLAPDALRAASARNFVPGCAVAIIVTAALQLAFVV